MMDFNTEKELAQDKLSVGWDESDHYRKFYPERLENPDFPNMAQDTGALATRLIQDGYDVRHVYYPANLVFNNHDEKIIFTLARRAATSFEDAVETIKRHANQSTPPQTIFLYCYAQTADSTVGTVRFFVADLDKKIQ
jgi:hypothetical protein